MTTLALHLSAAVVTDTGEVREGMLTTPDGRSSFRVVNGIPRFAATDHAGQRQTQESFAFKWQQRATYESDAMQEVPRNFLLDRYGFVRAGEHTKDELRRWCADAGLAVVRFDDRHESGYTVRAVRR